MTTRRPLPSIHMEAHNKSLCTSLFGNSTKGRPKGTKWYVELDKEVVLGQGCGWGGCKEERNEWDRKRSRGWGWRLGRELVYDRDEVAEVTGAAGGLRSKDEQINGKDEENNEQDNRGGKLILNEC